mmetsp:Transcript_31810/g.67777  ORF Transcript_31810/g.67777 Transcript_31810/m.67777 type:complete len:218 (-) Transcript_31810:626-1279(-)
MGGSLAPTLLLLVSRAFPASPFGRLGTIGRVGALECPSSLLLSRGTGTEWGARPTTRLFSVVGWRLLRTCLGRRQSVWAVLFVPPFSRRRTSASLHRPSLPPGSLPPPRGVRPSSRQWGGATRFPKDTPAGPPSLRPRPPSGRRRISPPRIGRRSRQRSPLRPRQRCHRGCHPTSRPTSREARSRRSSGMSRRPTRASSAQTGGLALRPGAAPPSLP